MRIFNAASRNLRKSRKGAIPLRLENLDRQTSKLSSLQFASFASHMQKIAEGPGKKEYREAVNLLKEPTKAHWGAGATGAIANPVLSATGRAMQGFVDTPGGVKKRLAGAAKEATNITKGGLVSSSVTGFLGGAGIAEVSDEIQKLRAKRIIKDYRGR